MAERVSEFPEILPSRGFTALYPWDDWLDGSVWKLDEDDASTTLRSLRMSIQQKARQRGLKVRTGMLDGHLYLQVTGPREETVEDPHRKRSPQPSSPAQEQLSESGEAE